MSIWTTFDTTFVETFGEAALGNPLPILYTEGLTQTVDGILTESARPEALNPGVVTRLFLRSADLTQAPILKEVVEVRTVQYSIESIQKDDVGGMELLLRKTIQ